MSDMPAWFDQLRWSEVVPFTEFVSGVRDRATIAAGAGLYAFSEDSAALSVRNALYVGKADGRRQTLQTRLAVYIRRLRRPAAAPSKHAGLEMLLRHYVAQPHRLFVRWCGCILTRDVEGGLIDLLDPVYNHKGERIGLADDELIPEHFLYDV